jgi:protein-S-isoprenylcysteine O-methyltransferase Ste14
MKQRVDPRSRLIAWSLVAGQLVIVGFQVTAKRDTAWKTPRTIRAAADAASIVGLVGMTVAARHLGENLTPSPLPKQNSALIVEGLYRYVRHPIYSFLLLFSAGQATGAGSLRRLGAFVSLAVLLTAKASWEERSLTEKFNAYSQYAAVTPRFVPWPRFG